MNETREQILENLKDASKIRLRKAIEKLLDERDAWRAFGVALDRLRHADREKEAELAEEVERARERLNDLRFVI